MFANLARSRSYQTRSAASSPGSDGVQHSSRRRDNELSYSRGRDSRSGSRSPQRSNSPQPQPLQQRLTETLLEATPDEYRAATQHPFLISAGQGSISKHDLSRWLSQDRLYAETYISFITSLMARVQLPYDYVDDKTKSLRWRTIRLLTGALTNIHTELEFFSTVASKYGLSLNQPFTQDTAFGPNEVTEQYLTLFQSFHLEPHQTLVEGLLVLWATEKCYLDAWTFAESSSSSSVAQFENDTDGGALRSEFIPNWTSDSFVGFVDEIALILDEWVTRENALRKVEVFKALWLHVLEIEKGFWPDLDMKG